MLTIVTVSHLERRKTRLRCMQTKGVVPLVSFAGSKLPKIADNKDNVETERKL